MNQKTGAEFRCHFKTLALLLASVLAALAFLEAGSRLLFRADVPAQATSLLPHLVRIFDKGRGYSGATPLPVYGASAVSPYGRTEFNAGISSQGFRDRVFGPKAANEYRIFMFGDSFTYGYGVEDVETIPKALERRLYEDGRGRAVSVVNAGVFGYGPWQERDLLREKGFVLHPDLVILLVLCPLP